MWCPGADTHLKATGPCSQLCRFSNVGMFKCNIVHRRSVAVLFMSYKIRCNQIMVLYGALLVSLVRVRVARIDFTDRIICVKTESLGVY